MQTLIPPSAYIDEAVFAAEKEFLFSSCWIFAGARSSLAAPDDWLTLQVGNTSVTLQNFGGEIKAYQNVCSHRFNLMRTAECGHGSLQCPYHGWIYGEDGLPSAIPSRPRFQDLDEARVRTLGLQRFDLDYCGDLIFIRLNATGPSLREYCGPKWPALERLALALGQRVGHNRIVIAANWKIIVENGLEGYHASFIHPQTLGQMRSNRFTLNVDGKISTYEEFMSPSLGAKWKPMAKYFVGRPVETDDYIIHSLFPTFSIDTIRGATYAVNTITPLSAQETRLDSYLYATKLPTPGAERHSMVKAYNSLIVEMGRRVVEEDKGVCETVQRGIREARTGGILSEEEIRILAFHRHYLEVMEATNLKLAASGK
jgi:phenylpropionate dioxygenase-like ring-hydroxylating dioxygenase large terminal subunit